MRYKHKLRWVSGSRTPANVYVTRVLNFGTWTEWQALKKRFSRAQIRAALTRRPLRGQWTLKGKRLAEVLFDCRLPHSTLISYEL